MFYENLTRICALRGINVTALCEKLGISSGNTGNWKKGGYPSADKIIAIADALDCTTDELLVGKIKNTTITERSEIVGEIENLLNKASIEQLKMFRALLQQLKP